MNKKTNLNKLKRLHSEIHWDIADMAKRLNREMCVNEHSSEREICYMIQQKEISRRERWRGLDGDGKLFAHGAHFESKVAAQEYIRKANNIKYITIRRIDLIAAEIVEWFHEEISDASDAYHDDDICIVCNQNAATKRNSMCRLCQIKLDGELDVTDQLGGNSPLALAQEMEPAPGFTKEEKEAVSRAAARRRIFPSYLPGAI